MKPISTIFSINSKTLALTLGFLLSIQAAFACPCGEVKIPTDVKDFTPEEGVEYMKTSEYKKEFDKAIDEAKAACEKHKGEKYLAIVSDIDETCLDNSEYFKTHKDWREWHTWMGSEKAPILKQTVDFLDWARKNGFAIFFITGRTEKDRRSTIANLVNAGLSYDGLYMRPNGDHEPAEIMKTKHRETIEKMGFKIIVSIGDQWSDLYGGHAEECAKLPNKMYFVK